MNSESIGHRITSKQSCLSGPPFPRVSNCVTAKPDTVAQPRRFPERLQVIPSPADWQGVYIILMTVFYFLTDDGRLQKDNRTTEVRTVKPSIIQPDFLSQTNLSAENKRRIPAFYRRLSGELQERSVRDKVWECLQMKIYLSF